MPELPKKRSMLLEDFNTIYTTKMLMTMAAMMFAAANSARKESKVVKVPAPAMIGKAMGTIDAVSGDSSL